MARGKLGLQCRQFRLPGGDRGLFLGETGTQILREHRSENTELTTVVLNAVARSELGHPQSLALTLQLGEVGKYGVLEGVTRKVAQGTEVGIAQLEFGGGFLKLSEAFSARQCGISK